MLSFPPVFSTKLISLRFPFVTFFRGYSMYFVTFFREERKVGAGVASWGRSLWLFRLAKKPQTPSPTGNPCPNWHPNGSLQHFGYCFFHFFCIYRLCDMLIHTDNNRFSSIFFKGIRCHGYDWNLCLFFI